MSVTFYVAVYCSNGYYADRGVHGPWLSEKEADSFIEEWGTNDRLTNYPNLTKEEYRKASSRRGQFEVEILHPSDWLLKRLKELE